MATQGYDAGYEGIRGGGWVVFASILLFIAGIWNFIDGILAIAVLARVRRRAHFVFSDLKTWGWIVMILGITQLCGRSPSSAAPTGRAGSGSQSRV